jgi:hypothetical protein
LKLFFLKGGHEVPSVLHRVTGRLKTEGGGGSTDDTPTRRTKKRRTDITGEPFTISPSQQTPQSAFPEGSGWSQTAQSQGQDYGMVGQNVDPGLQMPQGN